MSAVGPTASAQDIAELRAGLANVSRGFIANVRAGVPAPVAARALNHAVAALPVVACVHCALFCAWSAVTFVSAVAMRRAVTSGCKNPSHEHAGPLVTFAVLDEHGVRREPEDADPTEVLVGRWIAAHGNEDLDAAEALWSTLEHDQARTGLFLSHLTRSLPSLIAIGLP